MRRCQVYGPAAPESLCFAISTLPELSPRAEPCRFGSFNRFVAEWFPTI